MVKTLFEIRWSNGVVQTLKDFAANQFLVAKEAVQ
jgi:hypothetical protein